MDKAILYGLGGEDATPEQKLVYMIGYEGGDLEEKGLIRIDIDQGTWEVLPAGRGDPRVEAWESKMRSAVTALTVHFAALDKTKKEE